MMTAKTPRLTAAGESSGTPGEMVELSCRTEPSRTVDVSC